MNLATTECPIHQGINAEIRQWRERRRLLVTFRNAIAKHDGDNADNLRMSEEAVNAARALCELPGEFGDAVEYRVRAARSLRVSVALVDAEIQRVERRIDSLDAASTYDYSKMVENLRQFVELRKGLGPDANLAWMRYAGRIH